MAQAAPAPAAPEAPVAAVAAAPPTAGAVEGEAPADDCGVSPLWPLAAREELSLPPNAADHIVSLLLACGSAAASRALRATCRSARAAVDAAARSVSLAGGDAVRLLGAAAAAGRLPSLRALDFTVESGEPCVAALAHALQHAGGNLTALTVRERGVGAAYIPTPGWAASLAAAVAAHLPRLERFEVSLVSSDASCAASLAAAAAALPRLRALALPWSWAAGAAGALAAGEWLRLEELTLRGLGDAEAAALAALELPSLASLRFASCALGPAACAALARAPWFPRVRCLALSDCGLGADEAAALFIPAAGAAAAAAAPPGRRRSSSGGGGAAGGGGGGGVGAASLEALSLRGNRLRDAGAARLAASPLPALRRLSVAANHVTARGVAALAAAAWAPSLYELDLGSNPLVLDAGVSALAAAPLRLRRVGLVHTGLTDGALSRLAAAPWIAGCADLALAYNKDLGRHEGPWAALAAGPLHGLRKLDLRAATAIGQEAAARLGAAAWLPGVEELLVAGMSLGALSALKRSPGFNRLEARGALRLRA